MCKKVFQTKRAAFDSKAQALPDEAKALAAKASPPAKAGRGAPNPRAAAAPVAAAGGGGDDKKGAWEDKSRALREAMRAAREYKAAIAAGKSGADLPPPPASAPDPSLVQVRERGGVAVPLLLRVAACLNQPSCLPSSVSDVRPQLQFDRC